MPSHPSQASTIRRGRVHLLAAISDRPGSGRKEGSSRSACPSIRHKDRLAEPKTPESSLTPPHRTPSTSPVDPIPANPGADQTAQASSLFSQDLRLASSLAPCVEMSGQANFLNQMT
eukprot:749342-Hanusia_phi.AAC.1